MIVHVIIGLPGETESMITDTVRYLAAMDIQGINSSFFTYCVIQTWQCCMKKSLSGSLPWTSISVSSETVSVFCRRMLSSTV